MEDFIQRLRTFKLSTWMCKPKELSPVECAKRGYVNSFKDTITCTHCESHFNSSIHFESNLLEIHSESCLLNKPIPIKYEEIMELSIKSYKDRENSYFYLDLLPSISYPFESIDKNTLVWIFPSFPKVHLKSVYSLFGWRAGFKRVYCELCGIVIECSRKEYSLVKSRNIYNLLAKTKGENKLSLRNGIEITIGKYANLIDCHRYYCPWINDLTTEDFSYFTNQSKSEHVGWKLLVSELKRMNI